MPSRRINGCAALLIAASSNRDALPRSRALRSFLPVQTEAVLAVIRSAERSSDQRVSPAAPECSTLGAPFLQTRHKLRRMSPSRSRPLRRVGLRAISSREVRQWLLFLCQVPQQASLGARLAAEHHVAVPQEPYARQSRVSAPRLHKTHPRKFRLLREPAPT